MEGEDPLAPFGEHAADHLRRTDGFAHCPDLLVNSHYWADLDEVAAFEELVGSHGGLGGGQAFPFVLFPRTLPWPDGPVVGAPAVHAIMRGWLAQLGHDAYRDGPVTRPAVRPGHPARITAASAGDGLEQAHVDELERLELEPAEQPLQPRLVERTAQYGDRALGAYLDLPEALDRVEWQPSGDAHLIHPHRHETLSVPAAPVSGSSSGCRETRSSSRPRSPMRRSTP